MEKTYMKSFQRLAVRRFGWKYSHPASHASSDSDPILNPILNKYHRLTQFLMFIPVLQTYIKHKFVYKEHF
jgi:hypothetical protein